jgi:hypothetical protein
MTKPAYDLRLGYNSRQSYKLFKIFEQQWMKYDNNHLANDFITKSLLTQVSQGAATPGHKILCTELTTQMQCSF